MTFDELFNNRKPLIACVHLHPLPGAPSYSGNFNDVLDKALAETRIFLNYGLDGLIVENFRDNPFYPDQLPPESIAALAVITKAVKTAFGGPVGVNALRNDAQSAMSIAVAAKADFIRVNVHTGAAVTDQGIIEGKAWQTIRLRKNLQAKVLIFADVRVKHAFPLGNFSLEQEVKDTVDRGLADGVIVSGRATGTEVDTGELLLIKQSTEKPVLIGSGTTPVNISTLIHLADGFIVGSYFKKDGKAGNEVEEKRVANFINTYQQLIKNI